MRILIFLSIFLLPLCASAQILRAYGVIEIGGFPTSSTTGPKFAYRPADSSFYRWVSGSTWLKVIPDGSSGDSDTLYLKQLSGTTALVNGDTIDISTYFLKSDTTSAFASYLKRPVGWGLSLLTGKYPFVDSSKVASRYYAGTNPTTIAANYIATSNGTNLIARNLFDNNTYAGVISRPWKFGEYTTAGLPAGVTGYTVYNTTTNGLAWYQGSRWAYAPEFTFNRGTTGRIPYPDANGQYTESANFTYSSSRLRVTSGSDFIDLNPSNGSGRPEIQLFNSGAANILLNADVAGSTGTLFLTGALNISSTLTIGSTLRTPGLQAGTPATFNVQNGSVVIATTSGSLPFINFTESGVGFKSNLGMTTGNPGDLFYETTPTNSNAPQTGTQRFRVNSNGRFGIGTGSTINYSLEQLSQTDAFGFARGTVAQRPTIASSTSPMRFNTDSTAFEYGESVGVWQLLATRAYARSLVAGATWLKPQLEAGSVTIDADSNSLTFNNLTKLSVNQTDVFELATEQGKIVDIPSNKITASESTLIYGLGDNELSSYFGSRLQRATGITARVKNVLYGNWIRYDADLDEEYSYETSLESYQDTLGINWTGATVRFGQDNLHYEGISSGGTNSGIAGPNVTTPSWIVQSQYAGSSRMDWLKVDLNENDSTAHAVNIYEKYALPNENPDLNKSTAIGFFNGAPAMIQLARDTFIEDVTLFAVGTLMNSCQELTIVSSMTSTASTHMEIRFPDAADYLRGRKIIVYSKKKDAGSYIPEIRVVGGASRLFFTTNSAVLGTDPIDQSVLQIDDSTWSDHGTTFEFTCLKIDNTPSYRWVLKQR